MNTLLLARLLGLMWKLLVPLFTAVLMSQTVAAGTADHVSALSFDQAVVPAPTVKHRASADIEMANEQFVCERWIYRPPEQRKDGLLKLAQNNLGASRSVVALETEDWFSGASGVDVLESGAGDDVLADETRSSELLIIVGEGAGSVADAQRVRDFGDGLGRIRFIGDLQFKDLQISDDGSGNAVIFDTKNNQYIAVIDKTSSSYLTASEFSFSEQ